LSAEPRQSPPLPDSAPSATSAATATTTTTSGSIVGRAARRCGTALASLPPLGVLGLGWAILIIYAFPGQMTWDSFDHLREARTGLYGDSHPPFINLLWKLVEYVIVGPFGMLVIQSGLLLAGLYAIFRCTFAPRRAAWWTFAVFVAPQVLSVMAVIWKDSVMAGLLAVGIAGLLSGRRRTRLAGLVAMTAAAASRYNALGATLPLVVLLFEWRVGAPWPRRYAVSTAAWLATTFAAFGINAALTDKPMYYWYSSLAIHDIAGTLAFVDGDLSDAELRAELAPTGILVDHDIHAAIRQAYTPRDFYSLIERSEAPGGGDPAGSAGGAGGKAARGADHPTHQLWDLPIWGYEPAPKAQREAIGRAWWHVVSSHPWAYVQHRLAVTAHVLDLGTNHALGPTSRGFPNPTVGIEYGVMTHWSSVQNGMTRWGKKVARFTPLFLPWIYAALSLLVLPLALRHRDVLALLLSGLVMEGSLTVLAHGYDYRYSHWLVITTMVSCIVLAARRYRAALAPGSSTAWSR